MTEQLIAGLVAIGVVDLLEPVEIEIDQRNRRPVAPVRHGRLLQRPAKRGAVQEPGQSVMIGGEDRLLFAPADLDQVGIADDDQEQHQQADETNRHEGFRQDLADRLHALL